MTKIAIPNRSVLMLPTLVAVNQLGGSTKKSELEQEIAAKVPITEEQLAVEFPKTSRNPGRSRVMYEMAWARSTLKSIGALDNSSRKVWSITPKGLEYLRMDPSAAEEKLKAEVQTARDMQTARKVALAGSGALEKSAEEQGDGLDAGVLADGWRVALIETLKKVDPAAFERLATRILKEAGFHKVQVLGHTGDGGIDGVGVYKVSLVSFPIYFQCKRYAGSVGAGVVRDFRGAMVGRGDRGLVITTGTFTPPAREEATRDGAPPVDLIDGDELCDLILEYRLGIHVVERTVRDITVDESFFETL